MRPRLTLVVLAATLLSSGSAPAVATDPSPFIVHEWGTFTSVAGADGRAVAWLPLSGPQDLPCFVDRIGIGIKPNLSGTIRMETPVLYFYAPEGTTVDVAVRFRRGAITEWYPRAHVRPEKLDSTTDLGALESTAFWTGVQIRPGSGPEYPVEPGASHYYAARETDAASVQIGDQVEKFLFYRGVGMFSPPLTATVADDGRIRLNSSDGVRDVVLFDNSNGRTRYQIGRIRHGAATFERSPDGSLDALHTQLEQLLVAQGLYDREARAMVATWRDSWFEEGTRLIYLVPASFVDAVLPLDVRPSPSSIARVFVGRLELLTSTRLSSIKEAMLRNDTEALRSQGRFLWPAVERVLASASPDERQRLEPVLSFVYSLPTHGLRGCQ